MKVTVIGRNDRIETRLTFSMNDFMKLTTAEEPLIGQEIIYGEEGRGEELVEVVDLVFHQENKN